MQLMSIAADYCFSFVLLVLSYKQDLVHVAPAAPAGLRRQTKLMSSIASFLKIFFFFQYKEIPVNGQ